jgi:hypothetical protein
VKIDRHRTDRGAADFEKSHADLPVFVKAAREDPTNLNLLINNALAVVAYGCVAEPQSPDVRAALALAAQAHAALFLAGTSADHALKIGDEPVTYSRRPAESLVTIDKWIRGFYVATLAGDGESLALLARVSPESLRGTSTTNPEYRYLYMGALQAFASARDGVAKRIIAALEATDPDRPDVLAPAWTNHLDVHHLHCLAYVAARDRRFEAALIKALQSHKAFWQKTEEKRRDQRGLISMELSALACLAAEGQIPFAVESPYLMPDGAAGH